MNQAVSSPAFNYHLLRNALSGYKKKIGQLDQDEYRQVYSKATKSYDLESLVLASSEAQGLVIPLKQLDESIAEVASRYGSKDEFSKDLETNGLDEAGLRDAIRRELMFDGVMQRVAAKGAEINELDMRLFYEMHIERFETAERRQASHILITINPDFPENTRDAALARIEGVRDKLKNRINRFADFAKQYSECPTAMEGGSLGEVQRGQLYPELDAELFNMQAGHLSLIVESEIGFHVLLCEKIKPAKRVAFSKVAPKIRQILEDRQRRNCQKEWLSKLKADKAQG